jgi:hypothetical protein
VTSGVTLYAADPWYPAARASISLPDQHRARSPVLGAAPVALSRGKVVERDLTMPADFTLAFDIHPTGYEQNWASIVHYTDSDNNNRVPGIWFWPGTTKLHVVVGPNNHHINPDYSLPLNQWTSVRVQVAGATAKITIDGRDFDYTGLPARPAVTSGVTLYAADPWYPAARASIRAPQQAAEDYMCTEEVNFITGAGYNQDTMCGSVAKVMAECKAKCDKIGCTGFFYQEHPNDAGCPSSPRGGYQICGYTTAATFGTAKHGHRAGSQVCTPRPFN